MTAPRRLPNELVLVWLLFAVVTLAILVTYARLRPEALYHISGTGLAAGLSRALVYVNFPVGIAALAGLVVLFDRLPGRGLRIATVVAATLCAVVFWPGVVDEGNLDAKWVNAVPALGVGLAVLLTVAGPERFAQYFTQAGGQIIERAIDDLARVEPGDQARFVIENGDPFVCAGRDHAGRQVFQECFIIDSRVLNFRE